MGDELSGDAELPRTIGEAVDACFGAQPSVRRDIGEGHTCDAIMQCPAPAADGIGHPWLSKGGAAIEH